MRRQGHHSLVGTLPRSLLQSVSLGCKGAIV